MKRILKALLKTFIVMLLGSAWFIITIFFPFISGLIILLIGIIGLFIYFYMWN